jgi:nucleoside-diphosphate-sugar epimerase
MRVLLVGGTGLISTATTRLLLDQGHDVVHYNRGRADSQLAKNPPTILGDRKDYAAFEAAMAGAGRFDCVMDMICFLPAEAESAVRAFRGRTDHFVFCSTVDVYTKPASTYPIRENEERKPRKSFSYAYNKAVCERIFEEAHARGDFPVTIIRPAYTYGEGRGLLHTFRGGMYYLQRIRDGRPIVVHGDGTSLWASCHRDDVGRAFANTVGNDKTFGRSYLVTGEEWLPWNTYHQVVAHAMGAPAPALVHIPTDVLYEALPMDAEWLKENFQFNNIFDNSAAQADLGFRYTVRWAEGVRRIVGWLDERNQIDDRDEPEFYGALLDAWTKSRTQVADDLLPFHG